ncbi:MAG: hypothetical protein V1777_01840 [Candidatus Micrarchaeota archaeon]
MAEIGLFWNLNQIVQKKWKKEGRTQHRRYAQRPIFPFGKGGGVKG